jgi:hypothetical protein
VSSASKAAQVGPTHPVTSDALGNLAVAGTFPASASANNLDSTNASLGFDPNGVFNARLSQLSRQIAKAYTGTAMAFAMSAAPTLMPGKKFALSANWGTFQGTNGTALTGAMRIARDVQFNAAFAYGLRENMSAGRAGLSYQW